jgi:hypothetical protein
MQTAMADLVISAILCIVLLLKRTLFKLELIVEI